MAIYFETSVKYDKIMENGVMKKITEKYLVDALSFSEAEKRTIEELTPFMSGEFSVKTAKRTRIAEIFNLGNGDIFYLVKVAFNQIDEHSGMEKKSIRQILVNAYDFSDAIGRFMEGMKNTMADFEIVSFAETPLLDVFLGND